ncbi:unnamed protein product [Aspergillus oryzae var. brunneus]|uniref:Unnamed protein product n=1 Tax=Aspergillus oryzae var. brunneus TaxID=332754 RepID=A0ABQ6KB46_ASPOZ|nr:unnamed protein product [Aspergillus oryzae var. brunneus]
MLHNKTEYNASLWEGPTVFNPVSTLLTASNLKTETATLPSTGTISSGSPSLKDDVLAVRTHIEKLVQQGEDVLLALHSAGGFIGSEAMEGFSRKDREERGLSGGVVGIAFVAAAIVEEGMCMGICPLVLRRFVLFSCGGGGGGGVNGG